MSQVGRRDVHPRLVRLALPLPADQHLSRQVRGAPVLSPDGRSIAYAANGALYLRHLDDDDAHPVAGANLGVSTPILSPDGQWLAFWSARDSTFKKISIRGGAAVTVARSVNPRGATWYGDQIVVGEGADGIVSFPAAGGRAAVWIAPERGEMLRSPHVLPGGDAMLFTAATVTGNRTTRTDVALFSRPTRKRTLLIPNARAVRYVGDDSIVYAMGTTLFAARFDRRRQTLAGEPADRRQRERARRVRRLIGRDAHLRPRQRQ